MVTERENENCSNREQTPENLTTHHHVSHSQRRVANPDEKRSNPLYDTEEGNIFVSNSPTSPTDVFYKFLRKVRTTPPLRILWIIILILLVTSGNAMQIIGLNFWLRYFPKDGVPGNFTTLAASALLFGVFFLILLIVYIIVMRPSLSFARCARGWWLIFLIALMDAVNSSMAIYAASYTPEVLQALFTTLVPVYAAGFTKLILEDPRNYCNGWIFTSFFLIISGVVVASAYHFACGFNDDSGNKAWWSVIFFLSVPPTVLMNIWQSLYMIEFTYDPLLEETHLLHQNVTSLTLESYLSDDGRESVYSNRKDNSIESSVTTPQKVDTTSNDKNSEDIHEEPEEHYNNMIPPTEGNDTIVKLVMLAGETNLQFILIMMTLPMDALPWWGGSSSVSAAWENFSEGIWCLFNCDKNFLFCMIYTTGFVFTYIGSAYLNHYSVTLCSMIGQLSSPLTALLLIIVPKWDLEKGYTPWYLSLLAAILLCFGSLVYALWEEKTDEEKLYGERKLKEKLLARRNQTLLHEIPS
ncbi:uncharacterized protein TM35_000012310 [Trypanosoma theileri]|uniref:Uncharacterized protein n=1 Tax=Trypanosoma theileri TaxID=67003 RepID=A0A1X0P8U7_9TRYP|nr:uncharacterized protein TM35_000012310 [Trypanosoma theileri]ORC93354.1 hypothetical protein TM35_000012310 [Trypanosoma theileri]